MALITLTTDIGSRDYMVSAIKGKLYTVEPNFCITDITHEIEPYNYNDALYIFGNSYKHFPKNTWHIIFVNTFDKPIPRLLLAWHNGHYFAIPDNGLLPMVLGAMPENIIELPLIGKQKNNVLDWATNIGQAIQQMERGKPFHELGEEVDDANRINSLQPSIGADYIEGRIIFVDRFENVVVNIDRTTFDTICKNRPFAIELTLNERIERIHNHYGEVKEGDKLAFFNNAGLLEIAINKGNAAGLLGLRSIPGAVNNKILGAKMFYESVRIRFEKS